jgi:hypothetical protein
MKTYQVDVSLTFDYQLEVEATSKKDAEQLAKSMLLEEYLVAHRDNGMFLPFSKSSANAKLLEA